MRSKTYPFPPEFSNPPGQIPANERAFEKGDDWRRESERAQRTQRHRRDTVGCTRTTKNKRSRTRRSTQGGAPRAPSFKFERPTANCQPTTYPPPPANGDTPTATPIGPSTSSRRTNVTCEGQPQPRIGQGAPGQASGQPPDQVATDQDQELQLVTGAGRKAAA